MIEKERIFNKNTLPGVNKIWYSSSPWHVTSIRYKQEKNNNNIQLVQISTISFLPR